MEYFGRVDLRSGHENHRFYTSGAGLWVVTWLVELFDVEILFDSELNEGTTVTTVIDRVSSVSYAAEPAQNEVPTLVRETRDG